MKKYRSKAERRMLKIARVNVTQTRLDSTGRVEVLHQYRREGDEYVCVCGKRWDVKEEDPHYF